MTTLCQSFTTVHYCCLCCYCMFQTRLQCVHVYARSVFSIIFCLSARIHAFISVRLCVTLMRHVCECVWLVREGQQGREREREREREKEREMREVWELNGQTQCPDVLVHAVSLASFCNTTGFFEICAEVSSAEVLATTCLHLPSLKVMYGMWVGEKNILSVLTLLLILYVFCYFRCVNTNELCKV